MHKLGPLLIALLLVTPVEARAQSTTSSQISWDWLVVPFFGLKIGGSSAFLNLEQAEGETTITFGASAALLSNRIFGIEGDFAFVPNYFELGERAIYTDSYVLSATGNVILAMPLSVTREGLRPYIVAGGGLLRASADDLRSTFVIRDTMPAMTIGGGVIGMLSAKTGLRFDFRYQRSFGVGDNPSIIVDEGPRLSFFRAAVGYVRRF